MSENKLDKIIKHDFVDNFIKTDDVLKDSARSSNFRVMRHMRR